MAHVERERTCELLCECVRDAHRLSVDVDLASVQPRLDHLEAQTETLRQLLHPITRQLAGRRQSPPKPFAGVSGESYHRIGFNLIMRTLRQVDAAAQCYCRVAHDWADWFLANKRPPPCRQFYSVRKDWQYDADQLIALIRDESIRAERASFTESKTPKEQQMDILISWSKKQSREMAAVFHTWLPKVVPGIRPWMSSKDIDKGKQWFGELQGFLAEATSCIICVTPENVRSPWIYYETGAIAAKKHDVLICPYLIGTGTSMIADGPLAQYQCTEATRADTLALIRSLNKALANPHDDGLLTGNFDSKWPEFEQELTRVSELDVAAPADFVETDADVLAGYRLSAESRKLLVTAAASDGQVSYCRSSDGCNTQASDQILNEPRNARSEAIWEQAIRDLVSCGLLKERGCEGKFFEVTAKGYDVAEALQKRGAA